MSKPSGAALAALDDDDVLDVPADGIWHPLKDRSLGWVLVVFGAVAFVMAGWLTIEDWKVAVDPNYVPSCSLNVLVTCSAAMASWQGKLFGFPNPFIGLAAFSVVITTGVIILTGYTPPRWYRRTLLLFTTAGMVMICFLVWTSLYRLGKLCPLCMGVWASMIPIFWYQLVHAVQERLVPVPAKVRSALVRNRLVGVVVVYVALVLWIIAVLHEAIYNTYF